MLGTFGVGKTSLVARFVRSIFSDKYHTTVGVKIDKKTVKVEEQELTFLLWDLQGEDEYQNIQKSYLRGASGYLLVVDGTRRSSLDTVFNLQMAVEGIIGKVPFILVLNKRDLIDQWEIDENTIERLARMGWAIIQTSAKTGLGVEEAFLALAKKILGKG
jgi:hypothetical protein